MIRLLLQTCLALMCAYVNCFCEVNVVSCQVMFKSFDFETNANMTHSCMFLCPHLYLSKHIT